MNLFVCLFDFLVLENKLKMFIFLKNLYNRIIYDHIIFDFKKYYF